MNDKRNSISNILCAVLKNVRQENVLKIIEMDFFLCDFSCGLKYVDKNALWIAFSVTIKFDWSDNKHLIAGKINSVDFFKLTRVILETKPHSLRQNWKMLFTIWTNEHQIDNNHQNR